jgi:polyisoprenoid-binding protein YceI
MHRRFTVLSFAALMFSIVACATNPTPLPQPTAAPTKATAPTTVPSTSAPTPAASVSSDTVKLVMVPDKNEARYRVREQLAGVNLPSDAVGATKQVTGTIVGKLDGTIVSTQSKFRVDLRTLRSDRDQRDNFLRRNVLETDKYPYADFVPLEAPGLPLKLPADGKVSFKLIGDLTIRDVTKRVTWDVAGQVNGNEASGTANTSFNFAYFNLQQPRVPLVLSIEDNIKLELDIFLRREM